jgi:hypothetical protein
MTIKTVELPNDRDAICFKGKDADGKTINKYVCAMSPTQDAVELAFIDLTKGEPSITHIVYKKYGHETADKFRRHVREVGRQRYKDIGRYEAEELGLIEKQMR